METNQLYAVNKLIESDENAQIGHMLKMFSFVWSKKAVKTIYTSGRKFCMVQFLLWLLKCFVAHAVEES